eukprot:1230414-Alexandrium_andersonii.AAC.1
MVSHSFEGACLTQAPQPSHPQSALTTPGHARPPRIDIRLDAGKEAIAARTWPLCGVIDIDDDEEDCEMGTGPAFNAAEAWRPWRLLVAILRGCACDYTFARVAIRGFVAFAIGDVGVVPFVYFLAK